MDLQGWAGGRALWRPGAPAVLAAVPPGRDPDQSERGPDAIPTRRVRRESPDSAVAPFPRPRRSHTKGCGAAYAAATPALRRAVPVGLLGAVSRLCAECDRWISPGG